MVAFLFGGRPTVRKDRAAVAPRGFAEAPPALLSPRLVRTGAAGTAPTDAELMARLLALATQGRGDADFAASVLDRFGGFPNVLAATPRELSAVPGLNEHAVALIKLVQEAAQRLLRAGLARGPVLDDWPRLVAYLTGMVAREKVEMFRILFLDEAGRLIADEAQARGTVNHTPVYPREVARRALELEATGLILVHNHPSGDPTPSEPDIDMTEQVCSAVELFGVRVLDHVIIGNGRTTSFRAAGLLEVP